MTLYTYYFFKENEFISADTYKCEIPDHLLQNMMKNKNADMVEVFVHFREADDLMSESSHYFYLN